MDTGTIQRRIPCGAPGHQRAWPHRLEPSLCQATASTQRSVPMIFTSKPLLDGSRKATWRAGGAGGRSAHARALSRSSSSSAFRRGKSAAAQGAASATMLQATRRTQSVSQCAPVSGSSMLRSHRRPSRHSAPPLHGYAAVLLACQQADCCSRRRGRSLHAWPWRQGLTPHRPRVAGRLCYARHLLRAVLRPESEGMW